MLISIAMDAFRGGQQDVGFKDVPHDVAFLVFDPLKAFPRELSPGSSVLAPAASLSVHKPSADSSRVVTSIKIN